MDELTQYSDLRICDLEVGDKVEARIQACMDLMPHRWQHKGSATARALAAHHGESLAVWHEAASAAWARLKNLDTRQVKAKLASKYDECMERSERLDDDRDVIKYTLDTAKGWAALVGANAATRIEQVVLTMSVEELKRHREVIDQAIATRAPEDDDAVLMVEVAGELTSWDDLTESQQARYGATGTVDAAEALPVLREMVRECEEEVE